MNNADALVILSPGFPENEADSTCMPPQQVFVKNLKRNNPALNIIVLAFQYPYKASEYEWNGVTVISFGGKNIGGVSRLFTWLQVWRKLKKLNRLHKVIGVLSFWTGECALLGSQVAKRYGLKHYSWILGQDAKPGNKYFRFIKPTSEMLIALSDFVAEEFNRNYKVMPGHIVPVGIDPEMFGQPAANRDIDILAAGSLIPLKQYHVLVTMVNKLRETHPNIKAVLCGTGPEFDMLTKIVKDLGLEDNLKLFGEIPHTSVLKLMARTKVFVHPSSYEGFGVVCLEALFAGAQVVSFVRPMKVDIKNWHFANTPDDMQASVETLLNDTETEQSSVAPFLISDTNRAVMKLFAYSDAEIS